VYNNKSDGNNVYILALLFVETNGIWFKGGNFDEKAVSNQ